jgi:hypothetical protein
MKLKRILNEILDTTTQVQWLQKTADHWEGQFEVEDNKYLVRMQKDTSDPNFYMPWEVSFCLLEDDGECVTHITNAGNATGVFVNVISAIREWIQVTDPDNFYLIAQEKNRSKLYERMLKRFTSSSEFLRNYDLTISDQFIMKTFELTKRGHVS